MNMLRSIREKKGLTVGQLAARASIPTRILTEYEEGRQPIPLPHAKLIAKALWVRIEDLMPPGGTATPPAPSQPAAPPSPPVARPEPRPQTAQPQQQAPPTNTAPPSAPSSARPPYRSGLTGQSASSSRRSLTRLPPTSAINLATI